MKDMERLLRSMPPVESPEDFTARVMSALPARIGPVDRLGYVLKGSAGSWVPRNMLFPSTPAEFGLLLVSIGLLIFSLAAAVLVGLYKTGLPSGLNVPIVYLFPVLTGAVLLALAGWVQVKSPGTLVPQRQRLGMAALLFGIATALAWEPGLHQAMKMITAWLSASGLIMTIGVALASRFLFPQREVYHA